jgi:hypothetical protein
MIQIKFNANGHTYEEFMEDQTMKAIAFEYLIPLPLARPLRRETALTIVTAAEEAQLRQKYNSLNFVFSPLGLPFAPIFAFMSRKVNVEGFDRTIDFRANVQPESFQSGLVLIKEIRELFFKPEKAVIQGVEKAFRYFFETYDSTFREIFLAEPVTDGHGIYVLGVTKQMMEQKSAMEQCLSKQFLRHVHFDFLVMDGSDEYAQLLRSQGVKLFGE